MTARSGGPSHRVTAVAAVAAAVVALAGCSDRSPAPPPPPSSPTSPEASAPDLVSPPSQSPEILPTPSTLGEDDEDLPNLRLVCPSGVVSSQIFDYAADARGEPTRRAAVGRVARFFTAMQRDDGIGREDVVVQRTAGGAVVWLLRPGGSAFRKYLLRAGRDDTWLIDRVRACG